MSEQSGPPAKAVVHSDIRDSRERNLNRVYRDLSNWQVDSKGPDCAPARSRGTLEAAIIDTERLLGDTVTMPPTDNGWAAKAQVQDPVGDVLNLIQA
ncbi:hypothetical protein ACWGLF_44410 [Streptomyces puniciscabiei]